MLLETLQIKNYRSLEDVKLEGLKQLNVLIGRNNTGKSSIFGALILLNNVIQGAIGSIDWNSILTDLDVNRSLEIQLGFVSQPQDREQFFDRIAETVGRHLSEDNRETLRNSSLFSKITFRFKAVTGNPATLSLRETKITTSDGEWATIQELADVERSDILRARVIRLDTLLRNAAHSFPFLYVHDLDINRSSVTIEQAPGSQQSLPTGLPQDPLTGWLLSRVGEYLRDAFFFNPFRHSVPVLPVMEQVQLAQDGSNLAPVLHTIHSNNRPLFHSIEHFIQVALPDVGTLHPSLIGNSTEVRFRALDGGYPVRLYDMGGGIEQLLMIATVLLTTGDKNTLFLEEPESHLHAGAQRFLIERLYEGERQVFISTHSPTFVNISKDDSTLYQVTRSTGRTTVAPLTDPTSLSLTLEDIGVRNSDVLLSDAVLFVEGLSDKEALRVWSETLGISLADHNVTVLLMHGGEYADRTAPIRSELLAGISQKAPVPHLFVIDRDQRRHADVEKLERELQGRVHILTGRELENYLLVPRALRAAINAKGRTNTIVQQQLERTSEEDIERMLQEAVDDLYGTVLLKRIRTELGGLKGGLLTREAATTLRTAATSRDLPQQVYRAIKLQAGQFLVRSDVGRVVREQKRVLDEEWADLVRRRLIAPGEEILDTVFRRFGMRYKKHSDTLLIAQHMQASEIPDEIAELLQKVVAFTNRV